MIRVKKIAVFGGVFDPVHNGHLRAAEIVEKHLNPDIMLFIPSGNPPHKRKHMTLSRHRLEMLKKTVSEKFGDNAKVCDYEINEPDFSYTAKTLAHLKGVYGKECQLYFVIGADNITEIKGWYRPDIITSLATLTVVARPGFDEKIATDIFPECVVCKGESIDISSTMIRNLSSDGKDFSHLVPASVYSYIKENSLYPKTKTDIEEIKNIVSSFLKPSRMEHTLNVASISVKLAKIYEADIKKAETAALLHDIAKNLSLQEMLKYCEKYDIIIDSMQKEQKSLLHSIVAEAIAFYELGINDNLILNAIRFHTTGCTGMEVLTKIVFLADAIEPLRSYNGVDELRILAETDLDSACIKSLDNTISYLISQNEKIHSDTIDTRNFLIKTKSER